MGEAASGKQRRWVAISRSCPHAGADLLLGDLEDVGSGPVIACPMHTFLWDAISGACLWDADRNGPPRTPSLKAFDVQEESGEIWVRLKPRASRQAPENWDR